jgi:peroxiredoxin
MNRIRASLPALLLGFASSLLFAQSLDFAPSAELTEPLRPGTAAPSFTVREVDGSQFRFDPAALERPVLLITFRGGWCPYCNAQLAGLRKVLPEIRQGGVDVLFLSGDRPELLYSSLAQDTQTRIEGLDYHILSDAEMRAASVLGVAYKVPADTKSSFERSGRDVGGSSIDLHSALPVPAVFIVDTSGVIRFTYANPDYRVRLPAEEVRRAVDPYLTKF